MYRMASSFVQRDKGIFSPCFTYDNPNEYKVGKSNATVRIYFLTQIRLTDAKIEHFYNEEEKMLHNK